MASKKHSPRVDKLVPTEMKPPVMTVAGAIRELRDEVFRGLPPEVCEELEVTLRSLEAPEAEIPERLLETLAQILPDKLRKKIAHIRTLGGGGSGFVFPDVTVTATIIPTEIAAGEYGQVELIVKGKPVDQTQPVPTAVVLTLDESGSMDDEDNYIESRKAAVALLNSLRPVDEVALVTFSNTAVVRSNLTTDHESVKQILLGLGSPGGSTNLEQAFVVSNKLAKTSQTSINRMVILFTDGMPTPNQAAQENSILNGLGQAQIDQIQYFPVAYGSDVPLALLNTIAEKTKGKVFLANQITQLKGLFQQAFDEVNTTLFARDVKTRVTLEPDFLVRQGSLSCAFPADVSKPPDFDGLLQTAEADFCKTGVLDVPSIYRIDSKLGHVSILFDVTTGKCTPEDVVRQVTSPKSWVTYNAGFNTPPLTAYVKPVSVKVKACGVYWKKYFDSASRRVIVEIYNSFGDRSVYNIRVVEVTGEEVEPLIGTAQPAWPIAYPYYPSQAKDVWQVYGVEWKWTEILPRTAQKFSVEVKLRPGVVAKHGFDNPVQINQEKVAPIYDVDNPSTPANQPKEGGTIEYHYKDNQGVVQKTVADLPGCSVPDLPVQWPYK